MSFQTLPLESLRTRHSNKWNRFDDDVLPAWVADMDFALAPPIRECLASALERHDFGNGRARYEEAPEEHHDHLIDVNSGESLSELELVSPPVFDGLSVSGGRVFIATVDGRIVCLGKL